MPRLMLSDELWSKLEKFCFSKQIYHKPNLRMIDARKLSPQEQREKRTTALRMREPGRPQKLSATLDGTVLLFRTQH